MKHALKANKEQKLSKKNANPHTSKINTAKDKTFRMLLKYFFKLQTLY